MSRRRRHKRSYGSAVEVSLGSLPFMGDRVGVMDVLIGVGIGLLGSAVVKGVFKRVAPAFYAQVAGTVGAAMPIVTGALASGALYYAQKGSNRDRATGHAVGAALAGVALGGWDLLKANLGSVSPYLDFSEVVSVNMGGYGGYGNYGGVLINDRSDGLGGYGGVLIADKSDGLNELAAMSMAPDDDGLAALSMFR